MHERQDLGEARGKSETDKARQNLESEVLVRLNGLSEMSGLRPRSRDGRKSRTVTTSHLREASSDAASFVLRDLTDLVGLVTEDEATRDSGMTLRK